MRLTDIAILWVVLSVTGCSTDFGSKSGIGAMVGGLVGSEVRDGNGRLIATGTGSLLGAFIGSELGQSLDEIDERYAKKAYEKAIETSRIGETISWNNPGSGNSGTYTPTVAFRTEQGQYCRKFQQSVRVGEVTQGASGTACRSQDGTWEIVSN